MCKDGLLPMFLQKNHIPYDPDGSDSSDSSKLGGIWITGRKFFLLIYFNIYKYIYLYILVFNCTFHRGSVLNCQNCKNCKNCKISKGIAGLQESEGNSMRRYLLPGRTMFFVKKNYGSPAAKI